MSSDEPPIPMTPIQDPIPKPPKLWCVKLGILIRTALLIAVDVFFILFELFSYSNYVNPPLHTFSAVLQTALSSLVPCISFLRIFHILLQILGVQYALTNLKSGWRSVKVMCEFFTMLRFFLVLTGLPSVIEACSQVKDDTGVLLLWLYNLLNFIMLQCQSVQSDLLIAYKKAMNPHQQETDPSRPMEEGIVPRRCFLLAIWFDEECID